MVLQQCTGSCQAWLSLASFSFHKGNGKHNPRCKQCLAAAARARRQNPAHRDRLRQQERERSAARSSYIRDWQAQHLGAMAAARARRTLGRQVPQRNPPKGGRGSKSSDHPSLTP